VLASKKGWLPMIRLSYDVTARNVGDRWVLTVPRVGVTEVRHLDDAYHEARGFIRAHLEVTAADDFEMLVTIVPELGESLTAVIDVWKHRAVEAHKAILVEHDAARAAARALQHAGLSARDSGYLLGKRSTQHIYNLLV
jgi:hypothetical protein